WGLRMRVLVILGTGREGRKSELVARFVVEGLRELGFDAELIDVRDYPFCFTRRGDGSAQVETFRRKIVEAEALVIVSPEYNRSYPGELKMLLDTLYDEYADLPVGIVTVSAGWGGSGVLSELRQLCLNLGMLPVGHFAVQNVNQFRSVDDLSKMYRDSLVELAQRMNRYARGR
ncbi:MAG: NAD(P)H-dependent oxidoreductase, partial [Thermofilaceae archaeon]